MRLATSLVHLFVITAAAGCGARSQLRGESRDDASGLDAFVDRVDPGDAPAPDRAAMPDAVVSGDVGARVDVVCPAPIRGVQTATVRVTAMASSNLGRPLAFAWTVERRPMQSTSVPTPANALGTTFLLDAGGDWTLRFTATDDLGTAASCTVPLVAQPAIELQCPNDQSDFQGATLPLHATARSSLGRAITVRWDVESRPAASASEPLPATALDTRFLLDQLGDWRLRLVATDSAGVSDACRVNLHADPDVIVACPSDTTSHPFATITLAATARSRTAQPLTFRWEIVERPVTSTASIPSPATLATPFTFDVAGSWTYRFTATNARGNSAFCTTRALAASDEAVRVEIVWNTDRSCRSCNPMGGGIDIDLHVADVSRAMGHWAGLAPDESDCYFFNCSCGMGGGGICPDGVLPWPPAGRVNDPQLDIDHTRDLPGPENINVLAAEIGASFDVGVHYWSGAEPTPVVARIYCGGTVVFESEPVRLERGSGGGNNLWKVGRVTTTATGCTFARCGSPGNLGACIRGLSAW
jgi:hypothetical protein